MGFHNDAIYSKAQFIFQQQLMTKNHTTTTFDFNQESAAQSS